MPFRIRNNFDDVITTIIPLSSITRDQLAAIIYAETTQSDEIAIGGLREVSEQQIRWIKHRKGRWRVRQ
jgi:hypothetical protein